MRDTTLEDLRDANAKVTVLIDRLTTATELLRSAEWSGVVDSPGSVVRRCLWCGGTKVIGTTTTIPRSAWGGVHGDGCQLAAFLKGASVG